MSSDWLGRAAVVPGGYSGGEQHGNRRKHNLPSREVKTRCANQIVDDRDVIRKIPEIQFKTLE
jgi:hypothetical protein